MAELNFPDVTCYEWTFEKLTGVSGDSVFEHASVFTSGTTPGSRLGDGAVEYM